MARPRLRSLPVVALTAMALAVAACRAGGAPSPSPPGFDEVFSELARRGATVTQIVGGDPGCADESLVANAVRFTVTLSDGVPREVHLFGFRRPAALQSAKPNLDACRAAFAAQRPAGAVGQTTTAQYHAFGAPWSAELDALLRDVASPPGGSLPHQTVA